MTPVQVPETHHARAMQRMSCLPNDFIKQLESLVVLDAGDAPERIITRMLMTHVKGDRVLPVAAGDMRMT